MIQAFSKKGQLSISQTYFKNLIGKEINQKANKNISTSKKTMEYFLEAAITCGDLSAKKDALSTTLQYIENGNIALNTKISNKLTKLFNVINCEIKQAYITESNFCSHCKKQLLKTDLGDYSMLNLLQSKIEQKLFETGAHSFLKSLKTGKRKLYNQYYVLDVANVLYGHSKYYHKPNFKKLNNLVNNIVDENKHESLSIVLVLPRGGTSQQFNLIRNLKRIQQEHIMACNIDIISSQKIEDDLLVLYLAATNLSKTLIVSNDFYQKHLELVPELNKQDLSTWLQSVIKTFDDDGNIDFSPNIPVVLKHGTDRMHILFGEKKLFCIDPYNLYLRS